MKVFIADGAERTSLAIARSLGRKGIEVHCGETYPHSTTSLSRYCRKSLLYPDPQDDCQAFVARLVQVLEEDSYDAVYSSREVTTIPISYHKRTLERYTRVPYPDYDKILMTHDKARTFKAALDCGVPIPETYVAGSLEELESIAGSLEYPAVVKARQKTTWVDGRPRMLKVTSKNYVAGAGELMAVAAEIREKTGMMPLVQEYIPGDGYGVEVLLNRGEPRALFMHRRLREYPISGGASTLRESVYHEEMKDAALRLMKHLQWHGVAMVEFKLDSRDGLPRLMEVNGRFWGSLPLSIAAGVDFPGLLHEMVTKGDVAPAFDYRLGVKSRWLIPGDMLWFAASFRSRKDKLRVFREFFRTRGIYDDVLTTSDLLPAVGALRSMGGQVMDVLTGKRNMSGEVVGKT
jgi:predicted ATP-grasp superfamily ATP-dependent carboligase